MIININMFTIHLQGESECVLLFLLVMIEKENLCIIYFSISCQYSFLLSKQKRKINDSDLFLPYNISLIYRYIYIYKQMFDMNAHLV